MFQIKWEDIAINELAEIFEFWNEHNQSNDYSKDFIQKSKISKNF